MIIMIEGPDGSGKTTLAQRLAKQTGFVYEHRSKPKDEEERRNMLSGYYYGVTSDKNLIWDRCWYSEIVYGGVMRDQSVITTEEMWDLERTLAACGGGLIIHCTEDHPELLWDRATARGEDYIMKYEDLAAITLEYERLLHGLPHYIPVVRYELSKNMYRM